MRKECREILDAEAVEGGVIRLSFNGENVAANNIQFIMAKHGLGEFVLPRRVFNECAKFLRLKYGVWVHTTREEGYNLADIFWMLMGYLGIGLEHHVYTRMFAGCRVYVCSDEELPSSVLMRRPDGKVVEFYITETVALRSVEEVIGA